MPTNIEWAPNVRNDLLIGESGGTKYTLVRGQPVFIGVDGDSNAQRVVPTTTVANHAANGVCLTATADTEYTNDVCAVALWPVRINTTNVDGTNPPEAVADAVVYLLDAGTWSDTDTNSGGHSYGRCIKVETLGDASDYYTLTLTGMDET